MKSIAVLINTRDRPTELCLLLQSLRTQTNQDWDVFILDDCGGTLLNSYHFVNCMLMRVKLEGHMVAIDRTEFNYGVSKARQAIVDWALPFGYKYFLRVDDDVILQPDYVERLVKVIGEGYDMATGVTVAATQPIQARDPEYLKVAINRVILDDVGNYILNSDDCGHCYTSDMILPAHHFRSCALYKTEIHKQVNYFPTKFTRHGFREEQIFSYKMLMSGYKIGCDTGAMNYHLLTPSGGERFAESQQMIAHNQEILEEFTKEHTKELNTLFPRDPMPTTLELKRENNLIKR